MTRDRSPRGHARERGPGRVFPRRWRGRWSSASSAGFVDSVTLKLTNLKVHKAGTVKKVVTLGEYDLDVRIDEVTGRLTTGKPDLRFGSNQVSLALPVRVVSGNGDATIDFKWDGKNISGAVCGDMVLTEKVSGAVKPEELRGTGEPAPDRDGPADPGVAEVPGDQAEPQGGALGRILGGGAEDPGRPGGSLRLRPRQGGHRGVSSKASSARVSTSACPPRRSSQWRFRWASPRP